MDTTATRWRTRRQRPVRQARRAVTLLRTITVLTAFGVLVTACSHSSSTPGVASGTSSSSASATVAPSPSSAASAGRLRLARCMRAHGVHDFPDPDSNGEFDLNGRGDLNPSHPTYQAAARACGSSGLSKVMTHLSPQQIAATVRFAECMRNHGISKYPDPDSSGILPGIRHYGIDPNSSQFHAAEDACKHYMQSIPGWSS